MNLLFGAALLALLKGALWARSAARLYKIAWHIVFTAGVPALLAYELLIALRPAHAPAPLAAVCLLGAALGAFGACLLPWQPRHDTVRVEESSGLPVALAVLLLGAAALNYLSYDNFLLFYLYFDGCASCSYAAPGSRSGLLIGASLFASAFTAMALRLSWKHALRAYVAMASFVAMGSWAIVARAHGRVVASSADAWAALWEPAFVAVAAGSMLLCASGVVAVRSVRHGQEWFAFLTQPTPRAL